MNERYNLEQEVQNAANSVACLLSLQAKLDAVVTPGEASDVVDLRLTKTECAMMMVLIRDAFR